ncbi:MAG TPA: hypothetical protein VER33_04680, partial [Polyangiaceae bacterium]|nr:hypothetical protein [Polyangiaceae bacterium]
VGWKPETCTSGAYVEGECAFPAAGDYSCFKVPAMIDSAVCGTTMPQSSKPCTATACTACNLNNSYLESAGASKVGYCVCQQPNANGARTWTCASATAWPCPSGAGC